MNRFLFLFACLIPIAVQAAGPPVPMPVLRNQFSTNSPTRPVVGPVNIQGPTTIIPRIGDPNLNIIGDPATTNQIQGFISADTMNINRVQSDPRVYGAKADGVTDDTAALQAAVTSVSAQNGGTIRLPAGSIRITSPILVTHGDINFIGSSKSSFIYADLAAPGAAIKVSNGASIVFKGSIRDIGFYCPSNAIAKTAIEVDDVSDYYIADIDIFPWTGSSTNNIGILTRGRQFVYVDRCAIIADRPIVIGVNPNSYLSFDQSHVRDVGLEVNKNGPSIFIEDGVFLSDSIFDGNQSWNKGTYGFYWRNTTSVLRSLKVKIANARPEQAIATNGYAIYIESALGAVQDLTLENCSFPDVMPGLFMRNCQGVNLIHSEFYEGVGAVTEQANFQVIDASTNYCERVKFVNCFSQTGGTANTTGMTLTQRDWQSMGGNPLPESGTYLKLPNNRWQVNGPMFLGASDAYAVDAFSNTVSTAVSLHHTYTGTTPVPNFGIGTALDFYSDTASAHDAWAATFQTTIINPTNSFAQLFIKQNGNRFLEADFASDHITFYPGVLNAATVLATNFVQTPSLVADTSISAQGRSGINQTNVWTATGTNWTQVITSGIITAMTHSP